MTEIRDWFDDLNEEQQADVLEGIAEADRGETIPHEGVMKNISDLSSL